MYIHNYINMVIEYKCKQCYKIYHNKYDYNRHLNRKKPCKSNKNYQVKPINDQEKSINNQVKSINNQVKSINNQEKPINDQENQ